MKRTSINPFFALAALILLLGSSQLVAQDPSSGHSSPGPGNAPGALDDFNRRFIESCRNFNPDATADLWADDGVDLLPGMDPMVGKPAIAKWLNGLSAQIKGAKILQCDVDWQKTRIAGDIAYEWGINTQTISLPDQLEPVKNKGKITLILNKQADGSWKLALESWNSSPQAKAGT